MKIRILSEQLSNKIAAGEVVERPASVVKELLENALDSGADDILVEIEGGGKRLIRITDNGCGMSREDALLSLERHATSKIVRDDDLFNLTTLGFRGEALPSIASVSRLTLASREKGSLAGTEIYAEGGRIREVKDAGMAEGTVITVRSLFFNTPARLKFMRSNETEEGHVGELMVRLALSRPDCSFRYMRDGKIVFKVRRSSLAERTMVLLETVADHLYPVEVSGAPVTLRGLVGAPECSRSAGTLLYTYINGRFIRDKVVQHAILQAYRNFIERGRYPSVVLFLDIDPALVDVNVHPTKHEVRFRNQPQVHDAIVAAVEGVLRQSPWVRKREVPEPPAVRRVEEVREALQRYSAQAEASHPSLPPVPSAVACVSAPVRETSRHEPSMPVAEEPHPASQARFFSSLSIIGQFNAAYILCQQGETLVLIDQHAAHERIAFETMKQEIRRGGVESQGLLFPQTVELSHRESAVAREQGEILEELGFGLDYFGGNTWVMNGVPRLVSAAAAVTILRDILEDMATIGRSGRMDEAREELLAKLSCHSVVRGKHHLTHQEMTALLRRMDETDFSSNCPHGRPVHRTITLGDIEKMFRRT